MKKATLALAVLSTLALSACQKEDAKEVTNEVTPPAASEAAPEAAVADNQYTTESQQHSYALGASMGLFAKNRLDQQKELGIEYDEAALKAGFNDGLVDQTAFTNAELQSYTRAADMVLQAKQTEAANAAAASNIAEGEAYLAENALREGVVTTESGLQYEVLTEGTGASPASASSTVKVHYKGTLLDGTEFDSSYSRGEPATFPLNRVIAGWTEGVQLMKEGAKYRFHIPSNLAYGERATGKITPNATLVFDVELLEVIEPAETE
ncbi:FKBP-type peptidyl-prolyl cis-trans isomerase [Glaciecola sp. MH2013]|uniref:FKBP-type peptidyl-prolyl cis-trans isomerase n=1 Tax=Glaciecola sp. MH2013 TaxID=2785524 RepID=UPI00189F4735|nr:FKBP-type peptidyl-prolyl cis-trans isomerase [Glaciecola sp. MH2013]MBF7074392.1 FKBP-type peptidyl-prolyl cis-trans isomerase [Glaciecola sp. MH2013]